jgi:hypothetical protein
MASDNIHSIWPLRCEQIIVVFSLRIRFLHSNSATNKATQLPPEYVGWPTYQASVLHFYISVSFRLRPRVLQAKLLTNIRWHVVFRPEKSSNSLTSEQRKFISWSVLRYSLGLLDGYRRFRGVCYLIRFEYTVKLLWRWRSACEESEVWIEDFMCVIVRWDWECVIQWDLYSSRGINTWRLLQIDWEAYFV